MSSAKPYILYILKCNDDTLYTGITINIEKRLLDHNTSLRGAKYTRYRRPVTLVYHEIFPNKSEALKREIAIKKMPRLYKERLWTSG